MNKIAVTGRLSKDPTVRYTPSYKENLKMLTGNMKLILFPLFYGAILPRSQATIFLKVKKYL